MFRFLGFLLLSPLFAAAMVLRLAFFLPFALLLFLPMAIMRPRLLFRGPWMFRQMMLAKRAGGMGCGYGPWSDRQLERVTEPVRF